MDNVEAEFSGSVESSETLKLSRRSRMSSKRRNQERNSKSRHYYENILSTSAYENECWFCGVGRQPCGRKNPQSHGTIPNKARALIDPKIRKEVWLSMRIWIPVGNRCCPSHIVAGKLDDRSRQLLITRAHRGANLSTVEVSDMLHMATAEVAKPPLDLESCDFADEDYSLLFGISRQHFIELLAIIQKDRQLKDSVNRSAKTALGIFLMKLRLGLSQEVIGVMFRLTQQKVSSTFWRVAALLEKEFVPQHLGYQSLRRDSLLRNHDSEFVRRLYNVPDNNIVLFLDGEFKYFKILFH